MFPKYCFRQSNEPVNMHKKKTRQGFMQKQGRGSCENKPAGGSCENKAGRFMQKQGRG